jgi:hypothetical protein
MYIERFCINRHTCILWNISEFEDLVQRTVALFGMKDFYGNFEGTIPEERNHVGAFGLKECRVTFHRKGSS